MADRARPALVVVDDQQQTREAVATSLEHRFGMDYEIVAAPNAAAGRQDLERLYAAGTDAALIAANERLAQGTGTKFLSGTRDLFPTARRLVLVEFADNWVMPSIARAATLGEVDHCDYLPWGETDEHFLAMVGDIIAEWSTENGRGAARTTIVGDFADPTFQLLSEVLQRWQTYPISLLEAGTPQGDSFLRERGIDGPLPIVALNDGQTLTGANVAKMSDMVGAGVDTQSTTYDVAIIGLGPSGFSAAVNAASEGLRVILIEPTFSQASSSPMIRNYLGFPAGVSGAELMRRAWSQALMFGAVGRIGRWATAIRREDGRLVIDLDDGSKVLTDVIMLCTGVEYRRIGVESVDRLVGRGVFYGFSAGDALAMTGTDVAVVGGANSAVQAAIHLARYARSVHLIVRGDTLEHHASDYLLQQIRALSNATVHLNSEVIEARGGQQLRGLVLRDRMTGATTDLPAAGLFVMIGALPRTDWLPREIARDEAGFVLTGDDAPRPERPEQSRLPFETTMPGVFAVGDVRSGSTKRVAAAVGEGSAATQQVLRYRARLAADAETDRSQLVGARS